MIINQNVLAILKTLSNYAKQISSSRFGSCLLVVAEFFIIQIKFQESYLSDAKR